MRFWIMWLTMPFCQVLLAISPRYNEKCRRASYFMAKETVRQLKSEYEPDPDAGAISKPIDGKILDIRM